MNQRPQIAPTIQATFSTALRGTMRRTALLLAGVSMTALMGSVRSADAAECGAATGAAPTGIATPAMLYDQLRTRSSAQLLAIGFLRKQVAADCAWIYEVKMLTASGSVVELDFAAHDLALIGARGPDNDHDAAALIKGFGGDSAILINESGASNRPALGPGSPTGDDGSGDEGSGDGGNSGSGSGEGGEGGNSGPGGGDSGGDDSGGDGSDGGGESGEGGGDSGSGGSGGGSSGGDD